MRVIAATLLSLTTTVAVALGGNQLDNRPRTVPGAYIYEFEDNGTKDDLIGLLGSEDTVRKTFDSEVFKGISVQHSDIELAGETSARIASHPQVKNVWPVNIHYPPEVKTFATGSAAVAWGGNNTANPEHIQVQADKLHAKGFTGKGVKIAIIDTGIDYRHPALGGCFGKGCLISFGADLTTQRGPATAALGQQSDGEAFKDCIGHGTHVTGIIAAQPNSAGVKGVAPGATIGFYKVFPCGGHGAPNDVILQAIIMAADAGADIITASLGSSKLFSGDAASDILDRYVEQKGIIATVAAGNVGYSGAILPSSPASGNKVCGIGSFQNNASLAIEYYSDYTLDGGSKLTPFKFVPDDYGPYGWENITMPLWIGNFNATQPDYGCYDYPEGSPNLSNFIVLIPLSADKDCRIITKLQKAAAKGAKYVVLYSEGEEEIYFPSAGYKYVREGQIVTVTLGKSWDSAVRSGKTITLHMRKESDAQLISRGPNTINAGGVSVFSSWGPTIEMKTKPQFGAPGDPILSTFPRKYGSYAIKGGTSMATPLVAGAIALILEARGGRISHDILENLLSSTAKPALFHNGQKFQDHLAPVAQQGGGLIQAYDVAFPSSYLAPPSLSFNETRYFNRKRSFTIRNLGKSQVEYTIGYTNTKTLYVLDPKHQVASYPDFPTYFVEQGAILGLSKQKTLVKSGGSVEIDIMATPPKGLDESRLALWSGYITVNGTDGSKLSLPYQGLAGDFYTVTPLLPNSIYVGNSTTYYFESIAEGGTFRLPNPKLPPTYKDSIPVYVVNIPFATPLMKTEVISLSGSTPSVVGELFGMPTGRYDRGFTGGTFWLGKLANGTYAAKGKFKLVSTALRVHGDPKNPNDWFRSESVFFYIEYKE